MISQMAAAPLKYEGNYYSMKKLLLCSLLLCAGCGLPTGSPTGPAPVDTTPPFSSHPQPAPVEQTSTVPTGTGTVEGSLAFPGEGIPDDMAVCAQPTASGAAICTSVHIKDPRFQYQLGYQLTLPAGNYYVYATTGLMPDYKAYYNNFVECGLDSSCVDHSPKVVRVAAEGKLSQIDPYDWYDPNQPTP